MVMNCLNLQLKRKLDNREREEGGREQLHGL
jgi:hypothetical protein